MTDFSAIEGIFSAALGMIDPADQAAYLDRECGDDPTLRAIVGRLLAAREDLGGFLDPNGASPGTTTADHVPEGHGRGAPPTPLAGRYHLLEAIGEGGMGSVWMAQQAEPVRRLVAVKLIKAGMDSRQVLARFESERQALALMDHPNIARVLDGGEASNGRPFFVMELVKGVRITRFCDERRLTLRERLELFIPVCQAIQHAHQKGVIHRDVKPSNVLVALYDDRAVPKVIDFGVAKAAGRALTDGTPVTWCGAVVGTPEYMSPEQAALNNLDVDTRSDVYALGVLLYELLAGSPPISHERLERVGLLEALRAVREEEPPRPSQRLSDAATLPSLAASRGTDPRRLTAQVRGELDWIVMKALEKDRTRRYESAGALAADIQRYLANEPIQAAPPSPMYRLRKHLRRHRGAALAAGLMLLAVLAGVAGTTWGLIRADADRAKAILAAEREGRARRDAAGAAEASATHAEEADQARRVAARGQAELAMDHGRALGEQGEIGQGMVWLARSLRLADEARDQGLARAARINLAEWSSRSGRPLARLQAQSPAVDLAFRPDGGALVALGEDGALRCWESGSWREMGPPFSVDPGQADDNLVGRLTFQPTANGSLVVFDKAGRGLFWDAHQQSRIGPTLLPAARAAVRVACFVGDRNLVTCDTEGKLHWWDVATGLPVDEPRVPVGAGITALASSPDGSILVTGAEDGRVVFRNARSGQPLGPDLPHDAPVRQVTFLGDCRRVVVLTRDGQVRAWDKAARVAVLPPEGAAVVSLAVSPDGGRFATGTEGGTVRIWDTATLRQSGPTFRPDGAVRSLAFRPDGLALAVGLEDGSIPIWEVPRSGPIAPPKPIQGPVKSVAFARDGEHLLAVGDGGLERWRLGRRRRPDRPGAGGHRRDADRPAHGRREPVSATAVSPDGQLIAAAMAREPGEHAEARIALVNAESGTVVGERPCGTHAPAGLIFSPDSHRLLSWGAGSGSLSVRDLEGSGPDRPLAQTLGVAVHHAAFCQDGTTLLLGCRDGKARLWDLARDMEIEAVSRPYHAYPITAVAFDPRSSRVATGCHAGTVRLWDRGSGALLSDVRGNAGEVTAIAFSPDGATLLTASLDATARFWDVASGRQLGPPLRHTDAVLCLSFHPDGRSVATGTRDGAVWRWQTPAIPMEGDQARIDQIVNDRTMRYPTQFTQAVP